MNLIQTDAHAGPAATRPKKKKRKKGFSTSVKVLGPAYGPFGKLRSKLI